MFAPRLLILVLLAVLALPAQASAGLLKPNGTPLSYVGFATGPEPNSKEDFDAQFSAAQKIAGNRGVIRTGMVWNAGSQSAPGFQTWNRQILDTAEARGQLVLPSIRTATYPSDAEWTGSLRQIVRMYGPGGIYQKGGNYTNNGNSLHEDAHPGFAGMTDYELWNEPNMIGNLNGAMTAAKMDHLLKIGSAAMRDEASKMGFKINIAGPAVGGIDLAYVKALYNADPNLFSYINTLTVHSYMRQFPADCNQGLDNCLTTLQLIRDFMDSHGGANVHLGTTEGGYSGTNTIAPSCLPPNVQTEAMQATMGKAALDWLRARPNLDIDFFITYHPVDYDYIKMDAGCGNYDPEFWKANLGVMAENLTLKPWGVTMRDTVAKWGTTTTPPPPPASTTLVNDPFNRTVASGWGTAGTGGAWTFAGGGESLINGTAGVLRALAAAQEPQQVATATALNTDTVTTFRLSRKPVNGNAGVQVIARADGTGALADAYRVGVDVLNNGSSTLTIRRQVGGASDNVIDPQPIALSLAAATDYKLRVKVTGSAPTTLSVKVWPATGTEPSAWTLTATDSAAALQDGGRNGVRLAVGAAVTNAPIAALFDQISVTNLS